MAEDEIDLRKTLKSVIHHIQAKWILFTGLLVVFTVGGFVLSTQVAPRYETSMLISTQHIDGATMNRIFNQFNDMVDAGDFNTLSRIFEVDSELASGILSIKAVEDAVSKHTFEITFDLKYPAIIPKLNHSLPNYFEQLPYVQNRIKVFTESREKALIGLEKDIEMLDSAKNILIFKRPSHLKSTELIESGSLFNASSNIHMFILEVEDELMSADHFSIISPFYQTRVPVFPKKSIFTLIGFSLGLVLCVMILIGLQLKEYLKYEG